MSFMIFEDNEINIIWQAINDSQIIFHPNYFPEGQLSYSTLKEIQATKNPVVFLDRNLLSSILNLARNGKLENKYEQQLIALLMTWCVANGVSVSSGPAIVEHANHSKNQQKSQLELQLFKDIFEFYPSMTWLRLFQGYINKIPKFTKEVKEYKSNIDYTSPPDHVLMHTAEMLHLVYLLRTKKMTRIERICDFLNWNYDNLLICESTIVYVILLLTNQEGIKAPKNSMSNNINKVISGCKNQAWDLNYLSEWSTFFYNEDQYPELFLFATNDKLLKKIFIETYGGNLNKLLTILLTNKEIAEVEKIILEKGIKDRIKPNFGINPSQYFYSLIEKEKQNIQKTIIQNPDSN